MSKPRKIFITAIVLGMLSLATIFAIRMSYLLGTEIESNAFLYFLLILALCLAVFGGFLALMVVFDKRKRS